MEALIKTAGPRLTGSPGAAAAVEFMRKHMQELGLEAWLEPVVEAASFDELRRLGEKVKGKIVFFNKAMDRAIFEAAFRHSGKRP